MSFGILTDLDDDHVKTGTKPIQLMRKTKLEVIMTVTVLSKPNCQQCTATTRAFDRKGVAYTVVDMTQDPEALARAQDLGYRQAPVILVGEDHWSGFRPDKIDALALSLAADSSLPEHA